MESKRPVEDSETKAPTQRSLLAPRRHVLLGAAGAAALSLAGRAARAAGPPIKLGWVGPLSPPGGYAEGILMKDAAAMAAEAINAHGGVLGHPLEIIYVDTRGLPQAGVSGAERLVVQDHVVAAFGEFHSAVALAEMKVFHKYHIPFMACDVWSDKITAAGYPEVFRDSTTVSLLFTTIGEWIAAAGFKNIAVLAEKDDNGLASRKAVQAVLEKHKIPYTAVDAPPTTEDFTAQILRFKSHTPPYDFFFDEFAEAGAYSLVRESFNLGFAPTHKTGFYQSGGPATDPTFWKNCGAAGTYLLTENVGLPKTSWSDKTKAFAATFEKRYHSPPPGAAMESYDAAWLLAEAIESAGNTTADGIIDALEKTHWTGIRGRYSFSTSHDPAWAYHQFMDSPMSILQYEKEGQSPYAAPIVWPRKFATVSYLYKQPPGRKT